MGPQRWDVQESKVPKNHTWVKVKIPDWTMTPVEVAYENTTGVKVLKYQIITVLKYHK